MYIYIQRKKTSNIKHKNHKNTMPKKKYIFLRDIIIVKFRKTLEQSITYNKSSTDLTHYRLF